jgi:hypothetical protein
MNVKHIVLEKICSLFLGALHSTYHLINVKHIVLEKICSLFLDVCNQVLVNQFCLSKSKTLKLQIYAYHYHSVFVFFVSHVSATLPN